MVSAEAAAAAQEDGQQAAETGTTAAARPRASKSMAKPTSGAAKKPARSVAADMPASAVKAGSVFEPGEEEGPEPRTPSAEGPAPAADDEPPAAAGEPSGEPTAAPSDEATAAPSDEAASATEEDEPVAEAAERPMRVAPQHPGMRPSQHGGPAHIPRMPAKAEIFVEGDHVVYPTHGVGKVERIATEEIAGHRLELIHITFEENRMTLRVPVSKARSAGLRKLATRKMFDDALAVLKGRARIKRTMWSRRAQEYEAKINSGDPLAIAEVVRDLHRNAGQPDQSFSERQIYEAAMDRLAAELAALDKTDKPTAVTKLTEFLKTV
jgi:CarD family transcriptional regulator